MPWVTLSLELLGIQRLLTRCNGEASKLQSATECTCDEFILFPSLFKVLNWSFSSWKIMDVLAMVRNRCLFAVDADSNAGTVTYLQTTMWLCMHSPLVMPQVTSWEFFKRENPILRERKKYNLGSLKKRKK